MATWLHNVCIAVCVSAAVMAAGSCCCCGKYIVDSRERRKLSSQEGAAVVPTLVGLLQERTDGQKSKEETERLLVPASSEGYICRPCLRRLQKLQKLEKDVLVLRTDILGSLETLYPSQKAAHAQPARSASCVQLGKRTSSHDSLPPPAKRAFLQSPVSRRQLQFAVAPPETGKSPTVTARSMSVHCLGL